MAVKPRHKPKAKLTLAQRRARRQNRNPLFNPGAQLSGHDLVRAAKSLTKLEFGPKLGALSRERKTATAQGGALAQRASDYFAQLSARDGDAVARQAALSARTNSQLAAVAAESQGQVDQAERSVHEQQKADVSLRGEGLGGDQSGAAAALAAMRAGSAGSALGFRSAGVLQGANYEGLAASTRSAEGLRGGEIQGQLANRLATQLADIHSRRSEVAGQRGSGLIKNILDLRQSGFENLATMEGLGIKKADLQADIVDKAASRKLTRRQQDLSARHNRALERIAAINAKIAAGNLSETQRHNLVAERQGLLKIRNKTGGGGLTPTQRRAVHVDTQKAIGGVQSGNFKTKGGREVPLTDLLTHDPQKWGPKIHAQLQANYGKRVADRAMRHLRRKYRLTPFKRGTSGTLNAG